MGIKVDKVIDGSLKVLKDVSTIVLGTNKDGTNRSIIDAKIDLEKQKRKTAKKLRKYKK